MSSGIIPFFYELHLRSCPKTIIVTDYKLNQKTHRFEPKKVKHEVPFKTERYDAALAWREKHYDRYDVTDEDNEND